MTSPARFTTCCSTGPRRAQATAVLDRGRRFGIRVTTVEPDAWGDPTVSADFPADFREGARA